MNTSSMDRNGLIFFGLTLLALAGCQTQSGSSPEQVPFRPSYRPQDRDISKVKIVTTETAVKIGMFWRCHIANFQNVQSSDDIFKTLKAYAYQVVYSDSWGKQKGHKLDDIFSLMGSPIHRSIYGSSNDEALNVFLNFMIQEGLNEFPTRTSVDPAQFQKADSSAIVLYVETPQFKKVIFKEDLRTSAQHLTGFNEIHKYFGKLCTGAHVSYQGSAVGEIIDPRTPPK